MIRPEHCRLVILDRDGVINQDSDQYIKSTQEWIPLPGSLEAIAALSQAGFPVAIATNQSGIARGYYGEDALAQMHEKMQDLLAALGGRIDYIAWCPHGPQDDCSCRKPLPGLLTEILQHYQLDAGDSCFIGDSYRDYQAASALAMPFYLMKTGKGERTLQQYPEFSARGVVYPDLADWVHHFLAGQ